MLFLAALILAAPPPAPAAAKPICRVATVTPATVTPATVTPATGTPATDDTAAPSIHPLGHEPAARQVLAVLQTQGGCITPRVVRDMVGSAPRR